MGTAVIKKEDKRLKLSYRDYVLFPDCGSKLHEIIDGEHSNRIYDPELKRDLYEKYGVKEYWIIDPDEEMIEVYSLSGHRYSASLVYKKDQIIKAGIIPGLELALKEVFS